MADTTELENIRSTLKSKLVAVNNGIATLLAQYQTGLDQIKALNGRKIELEKLISALNTLINKMRKEP